MLAGDANAHRSVAALSPPQAAQEPRLELSGRESTAGVREGRSSQQESLHQGLGVRPDTPPPLSWQSSRAPAAQPGCQPLSLAPPPASQPLMGHTTKSHTAPAIVSSRQGGLDTPRIHAWCPSALGRRVRLAALFPLGSLARTTAAAAVLHLVLHSKDIPSAQPEAEELKPSVSHILKP